MLVFQLGLLLCLAYVSKNLLNLHSSWTITFWVYSLLTFILYLYTSQTTPGFVVKNNVNAPKEKDNKITEAKPNSSITAPKDLPNKNIQSKNFMKFGAENPEILPNSQNKHCESVNTEKSDDEEEKDNSHEYKNDSKSQSYKITVFPTLNQRKSQLNKSHSSSEINSKESDLQIKEIRYCTICKIDQPMRTKHCKECGRCIATHDHHCPWLGVCIGEKNKKVFYVYLVFQFFHILWAFVLVIFR
ncbi:hypothetical protein SteCoe_19359 [Stentor coeruleus]|uniref:Palmitoyltransferase n=1 Tax=Stentor coeruleus TaxID=5963 RepID=A0A1R2BUH0_9CILI|nr:hypothetical protein SteCoe_19359 [Stentor coeruleus]